MKYFLIVFGGFIMIAGFAFFFSPGILIDLLTKYMHSPSLYISAILIRLVLGSFLILTARQSRYPTAMRVIGVIAIAAAAGFIIIGPESFGELMSTLIPLFKPYSSIAGIVAFLLGGFLVYAYAGKRR